MQANSAENGISRNGNRNPNRQSSPSLHAYYGDQQLLPTLTTSDQPSRSTSSFSTLPDNPHSYQNTFDQRTRGAFNGNHIPTGNGASTHSNCDTSGRPMVVALNRTIIAHVGQQITVVAVFCCEPRPRKVLWIHRHLALQPASTVATYTASELYMVCIENRNSLHREAD